MNDNAWLPLTDYSTKYKVSVSTLRRRIKSDSISYHFENGKYFLVDQPMSHQQRHRPSQNVRTHSEETAQPQVQEGLGGGDASEHHAPASDNPSPEASLSSKEALKGLFDQTLLELKQAYRQVLQEKEEQILHLREEVSDLKTLVRVLESENARITGRESFYEEQ